MPPGGQFSRAADRAFSNLLHGHEWQGNLDAFDDILSGGFGTPEGGFVLRWLHSERSRQVLGYEATVARLQQLIASCHPTNRLHLLSALDMAKRRTGPTLFDELVEIIRTHGPGGDDADDGVLLDLA